MQPVRNIYFNPRFKSAHINPIFFNKTEAKSNPPVKPQIHVNPNFLQKTILKHSSYDENINRPKDTHHEAPLLKKTRRKIIRQIDKPVAAVLPSKNSIQKPFHIANKNTAGMIKIGKNKLVRIKSNDVKAFPDKLIVNNKYKLVRNRTSLIKTNILPRMSIVKKYYLCRSTVNNNPTLKKVIISDKKLLRIGSSQSLLQTKPKTPISYRNKTLEFLNINGVLYKSTNNKLEKSYHPQTIIATMKSPKQITTTNKKTNDRYLFVRGQRFLLESNGKSLKRVMDKTTKSKENDFKRKRIDIGGLTYLAKNTTGGAITFEQTKYHQTRSYINSTKLKSINVLTRKYVKSNIPCPIYRRLGKCLGHSRGRCPKVHDRKHVIVCPSYLKGECDIKNCLLSHDVNLSKMPTCKFYLQGCCSKSDCPYLHKKLNENVGVCEEFLKGYCSLADKCSKRHELPCSTKNKENSNINCLIEQKYGICCKQSCKFKHKKTKKPTIPISSGVITKLKKPISNAMESDNLELKRYFDSKNREQLEESSKINDPNYDNLILTTKQNFKKALPSYIPLN